MLALPSGTNMQCDVGLRLQREVTHEEVIKEMFKDREWMRKVGASDGVRGRDLCSRLTDCRQEVAVDGGVGRQRRVNVRVRRCE